MDIEQTPPPSAVEEAAPKTELWPAMGWAPHLAVIFSLGAIVLFAFANTLHNTGFALDNKFIILEDPRLRDPKWDNVKQIFREDYWWPKAVSGLYRPLTTLTYLVNYSLFGNHDNATGYHWINFFLHWLNAVLVYFVVLVLMEKLWPAMFTGAIFATHPIVTESVSNIIGRADLFATAAVLGAFLCYVKSTTRQRWGRAWWLTMAGLVTLLGVFCKESAIVVLGVAGLYDFTYRLEHKHPNWFVSLIKNFWGFLLKGYIAFLPALVAMTVVRGVVFGRLRPPELPFVDNPLIGTDFWTARMTAIKVVGKYFWLLLWPQELSCDYSFNQIPFVNWSFSSWEDVKALIGLASVIIIILVAIRNYHRNKAVFFFVLFFFGTLLPTSNLFPKMGSPLFDKESWCIGSIMAERFLYLPSIGYAGCVVIAVYAICRRLIPQLDISAWAQRIWLQVVARGVLSMIMLGYGVRAFIRNYDWEDDERLWSQAVLACPNSFKTHKSLAYALYEKDPEYKNIDRIILEGEKALEITDKTQIVFLHLGAYYRIKGDMLAQRAPDGTLIPSAASLPWYQKSADCLARAVPLDHAFNDDNRQKELKRGRKPEDIPDIGNHEIYWNLGLSYMRLGKYQEALEAYLYMRHLAPTNPDAYLSIASVFVTAGRAEDAAIVLLQALLLDSNRQEALRLLTEIYRQIDREGCSIIFTPGQSVPKLNADCALVRNHICIAYSGLVQVFVETKQLALARQTRDNALKSYSCGRELFEKSLPETAAKPAPPKS